MKLSVAMITYNHERFVAQAIGSVLAQKVNFDYEIVIGEDCSTDETRAVILDFQRRYPDRIVVLSRKRNIGAMRNVEATLAACRGQYVALLEGDDYWTSPHKLQKQVDFLDEHPDRTICCHRAQFLDELGTAEVDVYPTRAAGPYTIEDVLAVNFVVTCSTVLRRDLIPPLPRWFFEMKMGDWPLFALVAMRGKIELMDEVMAVYRVHAGGIWSSLSQVARQRETARMLRALNKHLDFRYTATIIETVARPYLELAVTARSHRKRMETVKHLVSCVRNGGWRLPGSHRLLVSLAGYALIGSWYKVLSKSANTSR